ncbi:unnamed protein product [Rotaria magnacalcarata]|uniref:Uncharacterized protein n=1 Tax=Rotaria magnacalcarata TaxID=392030 RepID=A0A815GA35_9BILA|nr:unnamed protein product [Rotaria magnacalcarata]CAF1335926.1 unnamed protein product [Rotaria magnacalcarata]CAF4016526.1 unnamed protein product [Rotaria magnacalcarata]
MFVDDEVTEENSSKYHTIVICKDLPIVEKDYSTHPPKNHPDDDYWIKELGNEEKEKDYKIQHIVANGHHTSSEEKHAIFSAFLYAYNSHEDIVLCPDDLWLMVCIYFSNYVNANAEQLRRLFVDHEGSQLLTIVQVGLIEPDWQDFLERIRLAVGSIVKNNVIDSLTANFSTTGSIESMLSCIAAMDTFKNYFEYRCQIARCGIRNVHFMGTSDDWHLLHRKIKNLKSFTTSTNDTFANYIDGLLPIIDEFINTYTNKVNNEFWNKVMDIEHVGMGKSGKMPGTYINGWFTKLCYGLHDKRSCHTKEITLRSFVVPVQVDNEVTHTSKMCYVAGGFHGVESQDGRHKPVMSLAIIDDTSTIKPYQNT